MRRRPSLWLLRLLACSWSWVACSETADRTGFDGGDLDASSSATEDGSSPDGGDALAARLDVVLEPATSTTELGTSVPIEVSLNGSDGFGGLVQLVAVVVDDADQPMLGWSVSLEDADVVLQTNGSTSVLGSVVVPTVNSGLAATVRVTATSDAEKGTPIATAAISVVDRYSIHVGVDSLGACIYPPSGSISLRVGSTLRWVNDASMPISIHVEGNLDQCPHQPGNEMLAQGEAYSCLLDGTDLASFAWGCHLPVSGLSGLTIDLLAP